MTRRVTDFIRRGGTVTPCPHCGLMARHTEAEMGEDGLHAECDGCRSGWWLRRPYEPEPSVAFPGRAMGWCAVCLRECTGPLCDACEGTGWGAG